MPNDRSVVAIRCITYNHEPYIRDCLEGFIIQKTNFPFVAIVHDDASTDGTAAIVREYAEKYPDIIKPIFETENQYSKHDGSLDRIMNNACSETGAKYIALCEGDDYWTDPLKLQKQVDFMEANPEYGLVYTDYNIKDETSGENIQSGLGSGVKKPILTFEEHLHRAGYIAPMSWLWRQSTFNSIQTKFTEYRHTDGSYTLALLFFLYSKVYFLKDITCTYRIVGESASHSSSPLRFFNYKKGVLATQLDFLKYSNHADAEKIDLLAKFYTKFGWLIVTNKLTNEYRNLHNYYGILNKGNLKYWIFKLFTYRWNIWILRYYYKYICHI
ncbi:MAG: glycosyltransferase [Muribaculaceae bacterium]